jgi:hypothetical protein
MQERKTRFEQVPIEVAKNALRLHTSRPVIIANASHSLRNRVPIRAGGRRFLRRRKCGSFLMRTS